MTFPLEFTCAEVWKMALQPCHEYSQKKGCGEQKSMEILFFFSELNFIPKKPYQAQFLGANIAVATYKWLLAKAANIRFVIKKQPLYFD